MFPKPISIRRAFLTQLPTTGLGQVNNGSSGFKIIRGYVMPILATNWDGFYRIHEIWQRWSRRFLYFWEELYFLCVAIHSSLHEIWLRFHQKTDSWLLLAVNFISEMMFWARVTIIANHFRVSQFLDFVLVSSDFFLFHIQTCLFLKLPLFFPSFVCTFSAMI